MPEMLVLSCRVQSVWRQPGRWFGGSRAEQAGQGGPDLVHWGKGHQIVVVLVVVKTFLLLYVLNTIFVYN
jgi:hypothetical protein